jgi:hypothetical protein
MSRQQKDLLRPLQDTERVSLVRLSRSASASAAQVARARALLAVAEGLSYTVAAHLVGGMVQKCHFRVTPEIVRALRANAPS